jgi:hypothetical protein
MYQLEEAVAAAEVTLTDAEMKALEAPYMPHPVLGHMVAPDLRSYARN